MMRKPDVEYPAHPGSLVRHLWLEDGESVTDAASRLAVPEDDLRRVLEGQSPVTPALALQLEAAGVSTAQFWMRAQAHHDLEHERRRGKGAA